MSGIADSKIMIRIFGTLPTLTRTRTQGVALPGLDQDGFLIAFSLFFLLSSLCLAQAPSRAKNPCTACHAQGRTQPSTSMGHASETIQEAASLQGAEPLTFSNNGYSYRIDHREGQAIYAVTDGKENFEIPIGWAVGAGRIGQTYVYQKDGEFYEGRVSYFSEVKGLDITIGHSSQRPANLQEAAGRRMEASEITRCFGCHMTNAVDDHGLALTKALPGVQCVRCHTSAAKHLAGLAEGELHLDEMTKLKTMSTEEISNFCGQCHRTLEEVLMRKQQDITTLRFQPYRLALSKCYDPEDSRISCLACHDPHEELTTETAHYDAKCLACHNGGKPKAQPCKVSKKDCTNCHMPKVEVPGSHHKFADHTIHIVKVSSPKAGKSR